MGQPQSLARLRERRGNFFPGGDGEPVQPRLSALLFILVALPSCFLWLAAGASLQRLLHAERAARVFNVAMGALLVGSLLFIL